jgi:type I restriction enzyme, S subunit
VLKPGPSVDVGYYSYLFKSSDYIRALQSMAGFIRDGQDLNFSNFSSVALPDVPQEDQRLIGRFLTYADRRIRRVVVAKQRLVKLLEEQKQVIINSVVTRGLDPKAPLKQSGVEWLGDVPAHWVTYRLKAILHPVDVRSTTGDETLLSLRREHGIVPYAEHFERPHQAASLTGFKLVEVGQLVVNRLQANNGLIFFSGLRGLVSPDYSVFAPHGQFASGYLEVVLRTHRYRAHFRRESTGLGTGSSGFLRLYDDRFLNTQVCLPSRPEQDNILRAIARQTSVIDGLIDRERRLLTDIVDYRARLISDVVTGKLDVREGAARLPEEPTTGWEDEPEVLEGEEPDADELDLAEVPV